MAVRLLPVCMIAASLGQATAADACAPHDVHFTNRSAALDAAALREIAAALGSYRAGTRFLLRARGHRPDPPAAAYSLARRRADAVGAFLVSHGVPARDIMIDTSAVDREPAGSVPTIRIERADAPSGCGG